MRDALVDGPDPREVERQRARNVAVMANDYESLRNSICMGLAPGTGIPQAARSLRENMHIIEPELVTANELPKDWESWKKLLDIFEQLWEHVKTSCTR